MAPIKAKQGSAKKNHVWTRKERLLLHLTAKYDWAARTKIVKRMVSGSLTLGTIRAQYAMRSRSPHIWNAICREPETLDERQERDELLELIRHTAAKLGVAAPVTASATTTSASNSQPSPSAPVLSASRSLVQSVSEDGDLTLQAEHGRSMPLRSSSDAATKLSGPGKQRCKVQWSYEKRVAVKLLYEEFQSLDMDQRTAIWNKLFKADATNNILSAQWGERRRGKQCWMVVTREPSTVQERNMRIQLVNRIMEVARTMQVSVPDDAAGASRDALPPLTMSLRKRTSQGAHTYGSVSEEETGYDLPPVAKRARTHRSEPVVLIANTSKQTSISVYDGSEWIAAITPPKTPSMKPIGKRSGYRRDEATITHTFHTGHSMKITPIEYARMQDDLVLPTDAEAYPPMPALLFRYWDANSFGKDKHGVDKCNSTTGFVAGRYKDNHYPPPPPPAPSSDAFPWCDVETHIDRRKIPGPFISVSNCFSWILRLAMKEAKNGARDARITLIDPGKMDRKSVYHVAPL